MRRSIRYVLALVVGGVATFGIAVEHDSLILFVGTFVTYALTASLWLRYPSLLVPRRADREGLNVASGVIAGSGVFGVLTLAQGIGDGLHLGAAVLGFGLFSLGMVGGVWMIDNGELALPAVETGGPDGTSSASGGTD